MRITSLNIATFGTQMSALGFSLLVLLNASKLLSLLFFTFSLGGILLSLIGIFNLLLEENMEAVKNILINLFGAASIMLILTMSP